jgi:hypothetical protein
VGRIGEGCASSQLVKRPLLQPLKALNEFCRSNRKLNRPSIDLKDGSYKDRQLLVTYANLNSFCREMVNALEGSEDLALINCALKDRLVQSVPGVDAILLADGKELCSARAKFLRDESLETLPFELRGTHP